MIFRAFVTFMVCMQSMFFIPVQATRRDSNTPAHRWWYNFPSSPLQFEPENADASTMDLKRLPGETILNYRLGCLLVGDARARVTKRLALEEINLKSGFDLFRSSSLFKQSLRLCEEGNPILAVVEVRYADGGIWSIE